MTVREKQPEYDKKKEAEYNKGNAGYEENSLAHNYMKKPPKIFVLGDFYTI